MALFGFTRLSATPSSPTSTLTIQCEDTSEWPSAPFTLLVRRPNVRPRGSTAEAVLVQSYTAGGAVTLAQRALFAGGTQTIALALRKGYECYPLVDPSSNGGIQIDPGTTAMRLAIQTAINSLNTIYLATGKPGVVSVPAGNFTLEDTTSITLKSGALVVGQGKDSTILNAPTTASTYTMFITPTTADGSLVNFSGNAVFGASSAASINVVSTGFAAGDYFLVTTAAGLIGEVGRVESIPDGTHIKPLEALHDTFTTAKTSKIKKINTMLAHAGLVGMTLIGTNATGLAIGLNVTRFGEGCRIEIGTRNWVGNNTSDTAAQITGAYNCTIDIEDENSGSGTVSAVELSFVTASKIIVWPHHAASVSSRWNFCHANTVIMADGLGAGSRAIKLSASNCNAFAVAASDNGFNAAPGNSRGFVFADSSHHNVVGSLRARDNIEIDLWFDGGGSVAVPTTPNADSSFSDDYNVIGALSTGGPASASNIFVGRLCTGNVIAACTPGATLDDQSFGVGLTIGNAAPIAVQSGAMIARDGTPALALQGANTLYTAWATATGESMLFNILMPRTYAATAVKFVLEWTNLGGAAGNVTWRVITCHAANAVDLNGAATTTTDMTVAAPTQNVIKRTVHDAATLVAANDILTVLVARNATADTLGNDAGLISVEVIPA